MNFFVDMWQIKGPEQDTQTQCVGRANAKEGTKASLLCIAKSKHTHDITCNQCWWWWWQWRSWSCSHLWSFTEVVEESYYFCYISEVLYTQHNGLQLSPLKQREKFFQEKLWLEGRRWYFIKLWKLEHQRLWIFQCPSTKRGKVLKPLCSFKTRR